MMKIILLIQILFLSSCSNGAKKGSQEVIEQSISQLSSQEFTMIHTFYGKDGAMIGHLYAKYIYPDVFSSMLIKKEINGVTDTLYTIDHTKLISKKGVETEVSKEGFYGYKIVLKKDDYIVLVLVNRDGEGVSDNITIAWNYKSNMFELLKSP